MQDVPGTKMVFPGMPDAAKRKEVIDYLATLK
jgi:cytochrome c2